MTERVIQLLSPRLPRSDGEWLTTRDSLNRALEQANAHGSVTLAASSATTVVTDYLTGPDSRVFFSPTTANAAAEVGNGTMYVSARASGSFTVTHANNSQTDRTFDYLLVG